MSLPQEGTKQSQSLEIASLTSFARNDDFFLVGTTGLEPRAPILINQHKLEIGAVPTSNKNNRELGADPYHVKVVL